MTSITKSEKTLEEADKAIAAKHDGTKSSDQAEINSLPTLLPTPIKRIVLLFTGSFNPVTIAHLRILELVRDFYHQRSIQVLEGLISPVSDSYGKSSLITFNYRLEMLRESVEKDQWTRIDTWEGEQTTWTRTRVVLDHHYELVKKKFGENTGLRYVAGADVLRTMLKPEIWRPEDIDHIMKNYGVACVTRLSAPESGQGGATVPDVKEGMPQHWKENIDVIQDWIVNDISATNIRKQLSKGNSVKYIVPDGAIRVIRKYGLYNSNQTVCLADWPNDNAEKKSIK